MLARMETRRIICSDRNGIMPVPDSSAFDKLKNSISKRGLLIPIYIDKNCRVVAGHYRFLACIDLGIRDVPIRFAQHIKEVQY